MKIKVTKEDIQSGKCHSFESCPIALAIKRQTGLDVKVSRLDVLANGISVKLPQSARDFAWNFDYYGSPRVKPFSFDIELGSDRDVCA